MTPTLQQALQTKVLVADGAMGTLLYSQFGINRDFESLNLTNGGDILKIHQAYIAAGADVIQTNTYAANPIKLQRYGLTAKLKAINEAAVSLAHTAQVASDHPVYVLGTIGGIAGSTDIDQADLTPAAIQASVSAQARVLLATGALDGILLETYYDLTELQQAITIVQELTDLPIVANVTMHEPGVLQDGTTLTTALGILAQTGVAAVGMNCHLGPYQMNQALQQTQLPSNLPVAIYPNAGLPNMEGGRLVYDGSPAYFKSYGEIYRQQGIRLIGGCCGTTPAHIAGLVAGLKDRTPCVPKRQAAPRLPAPETTPPATAFDHPFLDAVQTRKVALVELDPPKNLKTARFFNSAQKLADSGVAAITLSDGALASARISNVALGATLKLAYGVTPLIHLTTRDHNLIGLQAEIMGLAALGLEDVLVVTGDPAKVGDLPGATSVYDLHAPELIGYFKRYNEGLSPTGRPLGRTCHFRVGAALNPNVKNFDRIYKTIQRKVDAGADFIITQPVFDPQIVERLAQVVADHQIHIPIFVGVLPLLSSRNARFLHHEVPGIRLSDDVLQRMATAAEKGTERQEGLAIAKALVDVICMHFNGVHITTPMQHAEISGALAQYVQAKNEVDVL